MPLYRVEATVEFMVVADDMSDAWDDARRHAAESVRNDGFEINGCEVVTKIEDVPEEWRDSLPWGGGLEDDEKTCRELLADAVHEENNAP